VLALLLLGALAGFSLFVSCGGQSNKVVARIGDREITIAHYNDQYLGISPRYRPTDIGTMEGKRRFLEDLINKEIMVDEARRRGYADDPNMEKTMEFLTDQEVLAVLRKEALDGRVTIAPGDVRDFYDRRASQYHVEILMFADMKKAEDALARLEGGATFESMASESVARRAYPKADAGWIQWGAFAEPLNSAIVDCRVGEMTGVVEMGVNTWAIARVVDIAEQEDLGAFEDVRHVLAEELRDLRSRDAFQQWTKESLETYRVEVDEEAAERVRRDLVWSATSEGEDVRPTFGEGVEDLVLGTYEGGQLTVRKLVDDMMLLPPTSRMDNRVAPEEFVNVLRMVLVNEALLAEGYRRGIHERFEVQKALAKQEEQRIVTMLHNSIISEVNVTDEDVASYYDEYQESMRDPERYMLSRIVLRWEDDARSVCEQIKSGRSFEELAKTLSVDGTSASRGGKMAPATLDMLPPEIREQVQSLRMGQVGEPLKTEQGWMVIRLDGHTPERQLTLEDAGDRIRTQLFQARQAEVFEAWLARKKEEIGVEIYEDVLAEIRLVPEESGSEPGEDAGPAA